MKLIASLCVFVALSSESVVASAREPVRIDSTSEASFDASFAKLVDSLKTPERRTLALGLFGTLISHECLASEAIVHLTFSPVEPTDAALIRPCRQYLDGMSYQEILEAGQSPKSRSAAELPNNSFKPNPLRGSA